MSTLIRKIAASAGALGYRQDAILHDYRFSDFGSLGPNAVRQVPLAVFTQTPASYRSAAFGAAPQGKNGDEATVREHTSLGAPLFFVIADDRVTVWQVYASGPPRLIETAAAKDIGELFERRKRDWAPDAIHRAKSIGRVEPAYQLDFVDVGLLPAIEGQIHGKLDRLLTEALSATNMSPVVAKDVRGIFQGVFRLLAAKVLTDRGHAVAASWEPDDVSSVLSGIGAYYGLSTGFDTVNLGKQLVRPWNILQKGISVANISADDLAFVYENTLVTPETRKIFGTHSTPRYVAEYVVSRLGLWKGGVHPPSVYEPFAGAGVFLVSALRYMREALPHDWDDQKRHDLLVQKISGSEYDAFACEVATLSLILADYPNRNGWQIENTDLLENGVLKQRLSGGKVILCNPPFETLTATQRVQYSEIAGVRAAKAEAVLMLALQARPEALGFVLPQAFLMDKAYREQRQLVERSFREVELVSLPDGIFSVSQVESALLIARDPVELGSAQTVRSSEVDDADRLSFQLTAQPSRVREEQRTVAPFGEGSLWIPALAPLWHRLETGRTLGDLFEGHWGLRWLGKRQSGAASDQPGPNRALGILRARDHRQFVLGRTHWLDVDPDHLYGAGELPWHQPKILCNAARSSRGRWRLAAAVDVDGLRASQQFAALWPRPGISVDLDAYAALVNSPVANAFLDDHSTDRRLRITTLLDLPLPPELPAKLGDMAREYRFLAWRREGLFSSDHALAAILDEMDGLILKAFNFSPRMTRALLATFGSDSRPVVHEWQPWCVTESDPALTLPELRSSRFDRARRDWLKTNLPPVPKREADQAAAYLP